MSAALSQFPSVDMSGLVTADQSFTVRRNGGRPLSFSGSELCSAMSYMPGTPMWYEIAVYRTNRSGFVGCVKMFSKSEDETDRYAAYESDSFDDVISWLETYDAAQDVRLSLPVDNPSVPTVELGIKAAAASMRLAEARRQYSDVLGEVLYAITPR